MVGLYTKIIFSYFHVVWNIYIKFRRLIIYVSMKHDFTEKMCKSIN